jgi:hypothetical protein
MPRVKVIGDDGWVALDELASAQQMDSEHYRRCLSDRIQWAVQDAEHHAAADSRGAAPALRLVATGEPAPIAA